MKYLQNFKMFVVLSLLNSVYINCKNLKLGDNSIDSNKNQFELIEITDFFSNHFHNTETVPNIKSELVFNGCKNIFKSY